MQWNNVYDIDCFEGLQQIEESSVDLILVDLPYGKTRNVWDKVLPHQRMWELVKRVLKPNGVVLFFGQGIFAAKLIVSNEEDYKYSIVWDKILCSGFLNSKKMPLRTDETVMVFYNGKPTYNPQMTKGNPCHTRGKALGKSCKEVSNDKNYGEYTLVQTEGDMKYPTSIWRCQKPHPSIALHPTQKPVGLLCKLIETYTNPCDKVLDFCCGSGSTLVAAKMTNRDYIGMDNGCCEKRGALNGVRWAEIAKQRLENLENERVEVCELVTPTTRVG